ncbi:MAG: uroporphyrin-III methyltransferase [Rhodospirillaceae bacterium]|nr:uroporphyrin-III methyltransferase [Rhodospirillaceae bacterium]
MPSLHVPPPIARRSAESPTVRPAAPEHGTVWLVGAGPGDPGLLSLRALAAMEAADAVIHDAWIDPAVVALVPPACHREAYGERGQAGAAAVRRCIALARQGWRVVRLMHGDPLLSGDGAGEARRLAEAGVPFHVVPGIPARLAGLSGEAVPLAPAGRAAAVCLVDLEDEEESRAPRVDLGLLLRAVPSLVLRLRARQAPALAASLSAAGLPPSTPIILVARAGRPTQELVETTLGAAGTWAAGLDAEARLVAGLGVAPPLHRRDGAVARLRAPLQFSMAGAG